MKVFNGCRRFCSCFLSVKLVYCCSFLVIWLLLKIAVFNENSLLSIGSFTLHHQKEDDVPANENTKYRQNSNIITEYKNGILQQPVSDNSTTKRLHLITNNSLTGFPYDEGCFFRSYPNFRPPSFRGEDFDFLKTEEGKKYKTILALYHAYRPDFYFGFGAEPFESACCREKRCLLTNNIEKFPVEEFDAVLIHFRDFSYANLPEKRKQNQRWIFYETEPPTHSSTNPHDYEQVFNWTMTYRRDSDIVAPYGRVYVKSIFSNKDFSKFSQNSQSAESLLKMKSNMAAWMVSHCQAQSLRAEYVTQLQEYIQVDIYGNCGTMNCDRSNMPSCYQMIEKNYKFYLSFENSFCFEYVTEKFFHLLSYNIVPVVRGSGDYASISPPHSYIDVRDFTTPRELAKYLMYLDSNDTAYLEYFKWKEDYFAIPVNWITHAGSFCDLCYKLHNDSKEKIYYNLHDWFHGNSICIN